MRENKVPKSPFVTLKPQSALYNIINVFFMELMRVKAKASSFIFEYNTLGL